MSQSSPIILSNHNCFHNGSHKIASTFFRQKLIRAYKDAFVNPHPTSADRYIFTRLMISLDHKLKRTLEKIDDDSIELPRSNKLAYRMAKPTCKPPITTRVPLSSKAINIGCSRWSNPEFRAKKYEEYCRGEEKTNRRRLQRGRQQAKQMSAQGNAQFAIWQDESCKDLDVNKS